MSEEATVESQPETAKKRSGLSFTRLFVFLIIIVIIVAAGYFLAGDGGEAVAVVNGQKIARSIYDGRYAQLAAVVASQGQSATSTEIADEIKKQTLDNLVTETLLLQEADKEGIKVNTEEVNTQFTQSKAQFADDAAFQKALTDQGYIEGTFREFLTRGNIIQQYLLAHVDMSSAAATEEEVKNLYNQASASGTNVPPLEQVRAQVESQIVQQKQQVLITNFVNQLKASSTIETLI